MSILYHLPKINIKFCLFIITITCLNACTTATHTRKPNTIKSMIEQRATVLTHTRLSSESQSRLLQAGLEKDTCLQNMPTCIVNLKNANLTDDKNLYATISELFYMSAQQRKFGKDCQHRPREVTTEFAKQHTPNLPKPITVDNTTIFCQQMHEDDLLQTIRFAYIYLMYDILVPANQQQTTYQLPKERDIQIQDLYNIAIDELGDTLYEEKLSNQYKINHNQITVKFDHQPINKSLKPLKLVSSYQMNLTKLNSISRRDGIGTNYVAVFDDRYTTSIVKQIQNYRDDIPTTERIHTAGYVPKTLLLIPQGRTLTEISTTQQFTLDIYDPYQTKNIHLLDKNFSLSANFSAPYGLWLKENSLSPVSIFNMLSRNYQNGKPLLFMLEPYQPHKQVIIMLHGLASSPETWIQLTNDIFNDETLRENYQVWQIFYPTNIPILENRYQIHQLIQTAFQQADPTGTDNASHHAVIIGHSMGGIIGRLLVSNDDLSTQLKEQFLEYNKNFNIDFNQRKYITLANNQEMKQRFILNALPQVDRAIFISAPFRGTDYADKWFTRSLRRIISLPAGFVKTVSSNLNSLFTEGQLVGNPLSGLFLENGASQLSDKSFFVNLTKDVQIAKNIKVNTLIATDDKDLFDALYNDPNLLQETSHAPNQLYNLTNLSNARESIAEKQQLLQKVSQGATDRLSDGIVPYQSAHLDNVESETILSGKHNVHTSPQAVLTLRKILHSQLQQP